MKKIFLALVVLFSLGSTSILAQEVTYDYVPRQEYFDASTLPAAEVVVGDSGQIRPNQTSIFKDFKYALKYSIIGQGVLSIDEVGNWKALKEGEVTIMVFVQDRLGESPNFEAELDKFGIKRVSTGTGIQTTEVPEHLEKTIRMRKAVSLSPVYRLYHAGLKVHLYTTDANENSVLATRGWRQEGTAWTTSNVAGDPVYRLYHAGLKVHLYTKDANEYNVLASRGWRQEGVAYRSSGTVPVYRLYHKGIKKHLYTKDVNEKTILSTRGWRYEGVAWNVE